MRLYALRRWFALCAVVALSLGLVAQGFAAADMDAKMMTAAAAGDMSPASGDCDGCGGDDGMPATGCFALCGGTVAVLTNVAPLRSEEHTSELQSLMRISYAVFCLKKKKKQIEYNTLY